MAPPSGLARPASNILPTMPTGASDQTSQCVGVRCRFHGSLLAALLLTALALGGCSTSSRTHNATASAIATVTMTPTPLPQPVQVTLTVEQQGSVADHTLHLITTTTVSNHTSGSIGLLRYYVVPAPFTIVFTVMSSNGTRLWDNRTADSPYFVNPVDITRIAPESALTWTNTLDLSHVEGFIANLRYTVTATVQWHSGPVPADYYSDAIHKAEGQAIITVS